MTYIFVNLKRFDVPKNLGGICPLDDPQQWIEGVIDDSVRFGLGQLDGTIVAYLLPEALLISAMNRMKSHSAETTQTIEIGSQGVFREDIVKGGNFGAFTTNLPAAATKNLGCTWAIIGHSEERKDKFGLFERFEPSVSSDVTLMKKANDALNAIIHEEVMCAFKNGLNVLLCVGETAAERGEGTFEEQQSRIEVVLRSQLEIGLQGIRDYYPGKQLVIGYEPRWAIGPGKTPPGAEYIGFVSSLLKSACKELFGIEPPVVYGGGLKEENAAMIAGIETIDGGLVALTRFTGDIGFEPEGLKTIIEKYVA
jgi:triosephosphate isomerase (TIM)